MMFGAQSKSYGPMARREREYQAKATPSPAAIALAKAQNEIAEMRATITELRIAITALSQSDRPYIDMAGDIMREVAQEYGVTVTELKCDGRTRALVVPRHKAMHRIAAETPLPITRIGRLFGGRNNTTVLHAIHGHHKRSGLKDAGVPLPRRMVPR